MFFSVLASGSKANACYLEHSTGACLIDCGLSAREVERRVRALGRDPGKIQAIFLTHEHGDHIRGVNVLAKKYALPVFGTAGTLSFLPELPRKEVLHSGERFCLGSLSVHAFPLVHDALDPVGYGFEDAGVKFSLLTDTGKITQLIREAVRGSHGLVLESNHDTEKLSICEYPWMLKQRILSSHGHLSNDVAAELLCEIAHPELQTVVLGHLSENSNSPELALSAAELAFPEGLPFQLCCGSHAISTPLFCLHACRNTYEVEETGTFAQVVGV